jgi:AraC-like DNA-binding protein
MILPSIFFVLEGFGNAEFRSFKNITPAQSYMILASQFPMAVRLKATPENPTIVMVLHLDISLLKALATMRPKKGDNYLGPQPFVSFGMMNSTLIRLILRLLDCKAKVDAPLDLTPPEIIDLYAYFLDLPQGVILRRLSQPVFFDVLSTIYWLNERFNHSLSVTDLARVAQMSLTTFYRHFKTMTTLSPIQYIKTIRLLEARRHMLFFGKSALQASYEVGYESPSQFNREYKRFFYMPPHKEIAYTMYHNKPVYQPFTLTHRF